jgi:hypothetical protein
VLKPSDLAAAVWLQWTDSIPARKTSATYALVVIVRPSTISHDVGRSLKTGMFAIGIPNATR